MRAVIFSGQGSQKTGMGKEFYENFATYRAIFDEADSVLNYPLSKLCFEGGDDLNKTQFAQPALLTAGYATFKLLQERGLRPDLAFGLSLGEYTALVAAGVLDFATAVKLVHKRGQIMSEYTAEGGMLAAIGLKAEELEAITELAKPYGLAVCANYNTYEQIVLSGEKEALKFCIDEIKKHKGKAIALKVSGPFHSPLMQKAADEFRKELEAVQFSPPKIKIITNTTANELDFSNIKENLIEHMTGPVLWYKSVEKAVELGFNEFIELGSGNVLTGFVKKINANVNVYNVETIEQLEGVII